MLKIMATHSHTHNHEHEHNHQHVHEHDHEHCHHCHHNDNGVKKGWAQTYAAEITSVLILGVSLIMQHTGVFASIDSLLGVSFSLTAFIFYLVAILPVGLPVVKEMFESWRSGSVMNEFTLMVAAAIGAFFIGEYPEGVAVLLFYSFGEKMEDTASDDVKRRIKSLIGRLPNKATLVENGTTRTVSPDEVKPGDIVRVLPGERVAVDGQLLGERSVDFDTSAITGESVPRAYAPGEEISSGMIPVDTPVEVQSIREASDSSMSRIMKMIENAQSTKSPTENMLRRITRWYTPLVFAAAVLLFVIPWIVSLCSPGFDFEWMTWLNRSLVFLVCSCPCALVVSIPLSYFASLGNASRRGLLFKGSKYVDALRNVDTVVFDKTGTLTTGTFHISGIAPVSGRAEDADSLLSLAAAIDAESTHPLAKAIVKEAGSRGLDALKATDIKTVPHGITAVVNGSPAAVGSPSLMKQLGVELPAERRGEGSEICVEKDGRYLGSIYLLDTIKPEAADAIRRLHREGIRSVEILSGDRREAVERVANEIGADASHAELLPADKQNAIEEIRRHGHKVAVVGDGINDAPAIAASDVGVAMGTMGTDIAMESADVVISGDNLSKLPEAVKLARKVRHVVIENVSFALGVKAAVMLLGAFGIATLWAAVFADTGVTLITIFWTLLRLRK